jgi:hypothetical protein
MRKKKQLETKKKRKEMTPSSLLTISRILIPNLSISMPVIHDMMM